VLIVDIIEFLAGGWIFSALQRRRLTKVLQMRIAQLTAQEDALKRREFDLAHHQASQDALDKLKIVEAHLKKLQSRVNGDSDDLDKLTVMDAIRRETRAKAALKAIMKETGCSQVSIDEVLNSVDGSEDGDLKT